jgi:hypothetical protein
MAEFAQGSSVVIPIADVGDEAECIRVEGRRIGDFFIQLPSKAVVEPPTAGESPPSDHWQSGFDWPND